MKRCLLVVVLLAGVPAPASAATGHKALKHHMREGSAVPPSYLSAAQRAGEVLRAEIRALPAAEREHG